VSGRNLTSTEAKRLSREWRHRTERPLGLLLDNVQTPFNVGAILRTAASFRVDRLWLSGASATPEHDKTRKTSLGTERLVAWAAVPTAADGAEEARQLGMELVGVELAAGAASLTDARFDGGVCLVLGHEDRGLSRAALEVCDRFVYVPVPGKVGSLNVATAAAIALYEVRRQEWSGPKGVDLDPDPAGRTAGGGEGVGERNRVGGADEPPPVV
jgi:tRNA (guanosine-2'-O-)-methyltransferase